MERNKDDYEARYANHGPRQTISSMLLSCHRLLLGLEDGLLRSSDMERSEKNVLFPSLQNVSSESVARKLGKVIKDNLPEGTPREIENNFGGVTTQ